MRDRIDERDEVEIPKYDGLALGKLIFNVMGLLWMAVGAVGGFLLMSNGDGWRGGATIISGATMGGLFLACGAALDALRDIARNSFRLK